MSVTYSFPVKQQIKVTAEFKNESGALTDTTVVCKVRSPKGEVTVVTATKDSTGVYHVLLSLEEPGDYFVRFEGTGAITAATEEVIRARQSEFYG